MDDKTFCDKCNDEFMTSQDKLFCFQGCDVWDPVCTLCDTTNGVDLECIECPSQYSVFDGKCLDCQSITDCTSCTEVDGETLCTACSEGMVILVFSNLKDIDLRFFILYHLFGN